jgi:hypothetical protein
MGDKELQNVVLLSDSPTSSSPLSSSFLTDFLFPSTHETTITATTITRNTVPSIGPRIVHKEDSAFGLLSTGSDFFGGVESVVGFNPFSFPTSTGIGDWLNKTPQVTPTTKATTIKEVMIPKATLFAAINRNTSVRFCKREDVEGVEGIIYWEFKSDMVTECVLSVKVGGGFGGSNARMPKKTPETRIKSKASALLLSNAENVRFIEIHILLL